jgi:hypothetical protein
MDIEPEAPRARRGRLTAPEDPSRQVGREEFDEMVRDLGLEEQRTPASTATAEPDAGADLTPEDLVMKDDARAPGPKRPRNRRHGR